jgi:hypothetical protein
MEKLTSLGAGALILMITGVVFILFSTFTLSGNRPERKISANHKKGITIPALSLGIVSLVGGLGLFIVDSATLTPPITPTTKPIQTPTMTEVSEIVSTPEIISTEKPAITTLPVEMIPSSFLVFDGVQEQGFEVTANLLFHSINGVPSYTLDYNLPEDDKDGYVGMAISFDRDQNLSEYGFVQITIDFGLPDTSCDFYIKDISDSPQTMNRVSLGPVLTGEGISMFNLGNNKYAFTISLKENFVDTDFSAVTEIGFSLETPSAKGDGIITFSDIKFIPL